MGQALYRKYRSRSFDEVVGQEHIVETLKRSIKSGRISHAYLFSGPRGVGKTSVARILAHEVNGLPYHDESIHLDIIEIDAASNRRIDEIRDLREKVHISPTSAKYKVYIIDEAHMLTREAFNALLKTLEEPPAHCIFILATTEAHKLPETIISRTQRFTFHPISSIKAKDQLQKIARREKIVVQPDALELLALHGQGSFRDSLSLLDQLANAKPPITANSLRQMLGWPPESIIQALEQALAGYDSLRLVELLKDCRQQALDANVITSSLAAQLRGKWLGSENENRLPSLLRSLLEVGASDSPYESLEIALLEAASSKDSNPSRASAVPRPLQPAVDDSEPAPVKQTPPSKTMTASTSPDGPFKLEDWPKIIDKVKAEAASLYTALRLAEPEISDSVLTLKFQFPLHQKKIASAKARELIGRLIEELSGTKLAIECLVDKSIAPASKKSELPVVADAMAETDEQRMQAINNIFGGGQVLES